MKKSKVDLRKEGSIGKCPMIERKFDSSSEGSSNEAKASKEQKRIEDESIDWG